VEVSYFASVSYRYMMLTRSTVLQF